MDAPRTPTVVRHLIKAYSVQWDVEFFMDLDLTYNQGNLVDRAAKIINRAKDSFILTDMHNELWECPKDTCRSLEIVVRPLRHGGMQRRGDRSRSVSPTMPYDQAGQRSGTQDQPDLETRGQGHQGRQDVRDAHDTAGRELKEMIDKIEVLQYKVIWRHKMMCLGQDL